MDHLSYTGALQWLRNSLSDLYDEGEAAAIAREAMRETTGLSYSESLSRALLTDLEILRLEKLQEKLLSGMPLQYAIGHAWFMSRRFFVDSSVLIPRPETEELVSWVLQDHRQRLSSQVLDVGTGSGCIAVSLNLGLQNANVTAVDVSADALITAKKNASAHKSDIHFKKLDFLNIEARDSFGCFDVIVSNPPYIPAAEEDTLSQNVRHWEPHQALFVADNEPLIFYQALAQAGKNILRPEGNIYCELHSDFGVAAVSLFEKYGYTKIELRKDISGHSRMLKAAF